MIWKYCFKAVTKWQQAKKRKKLLRVQKYVSFIIASPKGAGPEWTHPDKNSLSFALYSFEAEGLQARGLQGEGQLHKYAHNRCYSN